MQRGSEKILQAWHARLDDSAVEGIAKHYDDSAGEVVSVTASDGALSVISRYAADDVEQCGNDLAFWLKFHLGAAGTFVPPRIIVNGLPSIDEILLAADFGKATNPAVVEVDRVVQA